MRSMELQLGLALPVHDNPVLKLKGFDLNDHKLEPNEPVASELWSYGSGCLKSKKRVNNKRTPEEAFGDLPQIALTFPLTLWNDRQPNEDDDRKGEKKPCILDK